MLPTEAEQLDAYARDDSGSPELDAELTQLRDKTQGALVKLKQHAQRIPAFAPSVEQAGEHVKNFLEADFSDASQLPNLTKTVITALKGLPGQDEPIQQDIAALDKELESITADITKRMGGDLMRLFREDAGKLKVEAPQTEAERKSARNAGYDRLTVLTYGIDSWTVGPKVTRERIEDLDEPTVQLLFEAILDLTFEDTESRKKDS